MAGRGARWLLRHSALLLLVLVTVSAAPGPEPETLRGEVHALQAQVAALLQRRSEDFKLLEESLRSSLEKSLELSTLRNEVDSLRQEVDRLRGTARQRNDHVTVQWLAGAVSELRAAQAAEAASHNASVELQHRQEVATSLRVLREDAGSLRAEMAPLRAQAQRTAGAVEAVRSDVDEARRLAQAASAQCADTKAQLETAVNDWMSSLKALRKTVTARKHASKMQRAVEHEAESRKASRRPRHNVESNDVAPDASADAPLDADGRRLRHGRRGGEGAWRLAERLSARVAALEKASAQRGAALDKLHLSQLQLLESVEALEAKADAALPDVRREVSKVEAGVAQLHDQLQVLKEDQDNQRVSVKALAGGQAALQEKLEKQRARVSELQQRALNASSGNCTGLEGEGESEGEAADLETRLATLEKKMHHMQMVPAWEAAWEPGQDNITGVNATNDSAVPSLVRQLAQVQEEYERIVSRLPRDCGDVAGPSGLYLVAPGGRGTPLVASCDQDTAGGGWTVVQRRTDGSQDFNRKWAEYADGFGSPSGEFWLGNKALHRLTGDNCSALRIDLRDIYGKAWTAEYSEFSVAGVADGFRLHAAGYTGNASDALDYQNRMQFSAIDQDRDISNTHCAQNYEGGWWFSHCQHANLNGRYNLGLTWFDAARNEWIAVAWSEMKVRRRPECS